MALHLKLLQGIVQIYQNLTTLPISQTTTNPRRETGFTRSGERIHRLSKRVTCLGDAPRPTFLQTDEGPPRAGERLSSEQESSGTRLRVRLARVRSPPRPAQHASRQLPSILTRPPAPPPSANSWAPRLPARTDFESVPCLPLRFSTISPGRGSLSSSLSLKARLLHQGARWAVCLALTTTMRLFDSPKCPHKRPRDGRSGFTRDKNIGL